MGIKKLVNVIILTQIIALINAVPYQVPSKIGHENISFDDLNETLRIFNKQNTTLQRPLDRKNASTPAVVTTIVPIINATIETLSLDDNRTLPLNHTDNWNETTTHFSVLNSTVPLLNLTFDEVDTIIEISDMFPHSNGSSNSTVIPHLIEFDQSSKLRSNVSLNVTSFEESSLNVTEVSRPSVADLEKSSIHELATCIKLVHIEAFNKSVLSFDKHSIQGSIKHAILKYIDSKLSHVCVNLTFNETINPKSINISDLPITFHVVVKTPVMLTEDQFNNALVDFSINNKRCNMENNTEIKCSLFRKDSSSLLRISDYWIELNQMAPSHEKLNGIEYEIFTYKPAWIVGLAIIGGIIAIFFLGCIVAICYTRRPYRRCGKVYEIDSAVRKNNQPYIPGVHPSTKASAVTKTKEMYYQ